MNLYEINKELEDLLFSVVDENGEIDPSKESELEELFQKKEEKLLNCGKWLKNQNSLAAQIKAEEKALAERRKGIEKRTAWLKGYVESCLEAGDKYEDSQAQIGTRKSQVVAVLDENQVPLAFIKEKITTSVDKTALKKELKRGPVPGVELVERINLSLK